MPGYCFRIKGLGTEVSRVLITTDAAKLPSNTENHPHAGTLRTPDRQNSELPATIEFLRQGDVEADLAFGFELVPAVAAVHARARPKRPHLNEKVAKALGYNEVAGLVAITPGPPEPIFELHRVVHNEGDDIVVNSRVNQDKHALVTQLPREPHGLQVVAQQLEQKALRHALQVNRPRPLHL